MDKLEILKDIALVIIFAKFFGLVARKLKAPQVVGEIIAGLIIGPSLLNWVQKTDFITGVAEIGVILLMFSAGLETNITQLRKTGGKATAIACAGVFVPLALGTLLTMCFYGFEDFGTDGFYRALFIGTILTATSVSITVQVLKELGKLTEEVGTTIVSAAIIDDVIGIIVLTIVLSFRDPNSNIGDVVLRTIGFIVLSFVVGYLLYKVMCWVDDRYPHTQRIPIIGLALALALAYIADKFFGIADITGAFVAGVILSSLKDSAYIDRKMDVNSYMIFGPVFFVSIGLTTDIKEIDVAILLFSVFFVLVGLLSKVIGCGVMSRICKFKGKDTLKIGVGMMTRGEVALIVSNKGLDAGMIEAKYFTCVILLILVSSILTPILLKILYSGGSKSETKEAA
jgi:Kef-type K+ transport system membrane component KefB